MLFHNQNLILKFQESYLEVDLGEMRTENRQLEVIARDGALRLLLPIAKFQILDLAGSGTLIALSKIRNGISNRTKTTRPNTDTRLNPGEFYEPRINRKIPIREMGRLTTPRNI